MQVEMYFDFMASRYARNGFLANVANQSKRKLNHVRAGRRLTRVPKIVFDGIQSSEIGKCGEDQSSLRASSAGSARYSSGKPGVKFFAQSGSFVQDPGHT